MGTPFVPINGAFDRNIIVLRPWSECDMIIDRSGMSFSYYLNLGPYLFKSQYDIYNYIQI